MKPLELWHIVVANLFVFGLYLIIRRWDRGLSLGYVGMVLILLPVTFAYLVGRFSLAETVGPILGVVILAADLRGKLPRRKSRFGLPAKERKASP